MVGRVDRSGTYRTIQLLISSGNTSLPVAFGSPLVTTAVHGDLSPMSWGFTKPFPAPDADSNDGHGD